MSLPLLVIVLSLVCVSLLVVAGDGRLSPRRETSAEPTDGLESELLRRRLRSRRPA